MNAGYNKLKKGFSMIELIIVIAVLGVLTAVVLNQAQGMRESSNLNRESSNLGMLATAVQSAFNSQGNYDGALNEVIKASTSFPSAMSDGNTPNPGGGNADTNNWIKTVWADRGVDIEAWEYNAQPLASFKITYYDIPESACVDFASQNYSSFFRMDVNGTVIFNKNPSPVAADQGADGFTVGEVLTACNDGGGTMTFYSR